jgi:hypothetical protein
VRRTPAPEDFSGLEIMPRSIMPGGSQGMADVPAVGVTGPVVDFELDDTVVPDIESPDVEVPDSKVVQTAWQAPEIVDLEPIAGAEAAAASVAERTVAEPLVKRSVPRTPVPPVPAALLQSPSPPRPAANAMREVSSASVLPPENWTSGIATQHSAAAVSRTVGPAPKPAQPQKPVQESPSMLSRTSAWWSGVTASARRQSMAPPPQARISRSAKEAEAREARHATGKQSHSSHAAADARRAATAPPNVASPLERATGDSQAGILLHRVRSTIRFAASPKSLQ